MNNKLLDTKQEEIGDESTNTPPNTSNLASADTTTTEMITSTTQKLAKPDNILMVQPQRFAGNKKDFKDWIRRIKSIKRTKRYDDCEILNYSISLLTGEAGEYFDNLKEEPKSLEKFFEVMDKRYGECRLDRPTLYKKILSRIQKPHEKTQKFFEEIFKMG
ncbi:hypothetical protein GVAV_002707 [Gurleya vavrai]